MYPAGRNEAAVPAVRLPPVIGIVGNAVPTCPVTGVATVAVVDPRVDATSTGTKGEPVKVLVSVTVLAVAVTLIEVIPPAT